jgi:hypothetical protein
MALLNWLISVGLDLKGLILTGFGAIVGGLLKWVLDRNLILELGQENKKIIDKLDKISLNMPKVRLC